MRRTLFALVSSCVLLALIAVTSTEHGYFLPLLLLGVAYIFWSYPHPVRAIATIVVMNAYVIEQSAGITPLEIGVGIYLYGYLAYWFFVKFFIAREPLFTHTSEWALAGFLVVCLVSVVLLAAAESRIDYWFREFLTLSTFLLCLPARDAMRSRRGVTVIFGAFAAMVVTLAVINIVRYRASTLAASYLWELWGGRQAFGTALYAFLALGAVSLHLHVEGGWKRIGTLVVAAVAAIALGTTFYRGFWIGATLGGISLFFLVDRTQKMRLFITTAAGSAVGSALVFLVAGSLAWSVLEALVVRFASSGNALADISIANRIAESRTVLGLIAQSPLVGHGLGVWFHHLNIITRTTEVVMYVHNVYLYLLLEVGVLGFALFAVYYASVLREGIRISARAAIVPFRKAMVRASVAILIGFLFVATNSGLLQDKQAILIMVLGTAVITSSRSV